MNNRALTLSLVMAILAVFFVSSYVSSIQEEAEKREGTKVMVITAKRDIKEMETINDTVFEPKLIPKKYVEPDAILFRGKKEDDPEAMKSLKALTGTVAMVPIKQGEQLTYSKINDLGIRTGLSPQISPGKRAFAIPVNEISGVSKLVKPGDRIDLIAVIDPGAGGKDARVSKTILQDVVVLSVGRSVTNNAPRVMEADGFDGKVRSKSLAEDYTFSTVTLEVEPLQAQALALAISGGDNQLFLSLRNADDSERAQIGGTLLPDMLGQDAMRIPRRGPAGK